MATSGGWWQSAAARRRLEAARMLELAINRRDAIWVDEALAAGADSNMEMRRGSIEASALGFAAQDGNLDAVQSLLGAGASVNAKDNVGWTPFLRAVASMNCDVMRALQKAGAHIDASDTSGATALMIASRHLQVDVVRVLLAAGLTVNAQDIHGDTALSLAAQEGNNDVVHLLLAEGARVNAENYAGWTPLHHAADKNHLRVVQLLMEWGAEVNAASSSHAQSALELAVNCKHVEVTRELLASGADLPPALLARSELSRQEKFEMLATAAWAKRAALQALRQCLLADA